MSFSKNLRIAFKFYWKAVFIIFYPVCLLPIFLVNNNTSNRCIYVIVLMAGLWITEALPIPITSLIPIALFPLMGILDSKETAACYITEPTILLIAGYMLALAVESSNLQMRISLHIIKLIGFSPRKLHIGFTCVTMFISMWISNTATTALMIPIVFTTLKELEEHGVGRIFEEEARLEQDEEGPDEVNRRPTRSTMGYFITIAYASTIGGTGYLTGNASNLAYKGIYETAFPNLKVNSGHWLLLCVPFMLITMFITFFWIELLYMGLFRPKSSAAEQFKASTEETVAAKAYIVEKLQRMGWITFHEIAVATCFLAAVILWVLREPQFFPGWADFWVPYDTTIKDATAGVAILLILFLVPRTTRCCYTFSSDEEKKPNSQSNGLLTWKYSLRRIPWALIFVIGAGFSIAQGSHNSGLSERMTRDLEGMETYSPFGVLAVAALAATLMTQLTTNVAVSGMLIPILATIAKATDVHPQYIMWSSTIACSFAYLFPVSTPPNALVANYINIPTTEMMKVGFGTAIISYMVLLMIFAGFLPFLIEIDKFPLDAYMELDPGVSTTVKE
ncbi:protein I'm not dead yet-like [Coccinella septempunctata]|uniref:protein I'm not dead yet-like n=1 Tax=Coccinella septempunctata TaxID=41139 RepID=UPI001D080FE3|nr:protein I'm not dead yet-like [Coccinella septempunctata]